MPIKPNDPVFPISEWDTAIVGEHGVILFCPSFLTHASQHPSQPNPGRVYALTAQQARYLVLDIEKRLHQLETASSSSKPGPPDRESSH